MKIWSFNEAGVAVAMAIETPELATGEIFGIRMGWGGFDRFKSDANAIGASAIGVLRRNLFTQSDRLAVDAGVGWGWSEFKDYKLTGVVAGRGGLQLTWKLYQTIELAWVGLVSCPAIPFTSSTSLAGTLKPFSAASLRN